MKRNTFRKVFKTSGPAVLPVIHTRDLDEALRNCHVAMRCGAQGVFLINHDFHHDQLVPILKSVRAAMPWLWLGVNFLGVTGKNAFPVLGDLQRDGCEIDAYWADDARIDERQETQTDAETIDRARNECGWTGLYFGGVAFKKQRPVAAANYGHSAKLARRHMDVITTSGVATGAAADLDKIRTFRAASEDHPVAIASGITPGNVADYAPHVDAILVATGINRDGDFYNIAPEKLSRLLANVRETAPDA
ncbi:MAG: BtpA/SgcQ family protein [Pseudomonadota bacterium]